MSDTTEVSLDELFSMRGSDESQRESRDTFTVKTGVYKFQATSHRAMRLGEDAAWCPGRALISFTGTVESQQYDKPMRFSLLVSPEDVRNDKGRLDNLSKLYYQIMTAFDLKATETHAGALVEMMNRYPVMLRVREAFKTEMGWASARNEEPYGITVNNEFVPAGTARGRYQVKNFTDSVYKVK